jgi:hypothetical protein
MKGGGGRAAKIIHRPLPPAYSSPPRILKILLISLTLFNSYA